MWNPMSLRNRVEGTPHWSLSMSLFDWCNNFQVQREESSEGKDSDSTRTTTAARHPQSAQRKLSVNSKRSEIWNFSEHWDLVYLSLKSWKSFVGKREYSASKRREITTSTKRTDKLSPNSLKRKRGRGLNQIWPLTVKGRSENSDLQSASEFEPKHLVKTVSFDYYWIIV